MPAQHAILFGGNFAVLVWHLFPQWRKTSMRNIELFFDGQKSPQEAWRIGRKAAQNVGYHVMEFILLGHRKKEDIIEMVVETEGEAEYRAAYEEGKGVICLGMHYGNWELCASWMQTEVRPIHAVGKKQADPFFTEIAFPWRARFGVKNIYAGAQANSAILRALKNGDGLGLVADINGGTTGVFVPFAGIMASTVAGPGVLGLRSGAPMFLTICRRLEPGRHRFIARRLDLEGLPADRQEAQLEILRRVNCMYEEAIREDPTQWLWGHKRWKTRPEGEAWLY
jgi:KDO2-lipid IV(A) lauroyltransferase